MDQGELERRWRRSVRRYLDAAAATGHVPIYGIRTAERFAASCREEPLTLCPFCLCRPVQTSSGTCWRCAFERGLVARGPGRRVRADGEPVTRAQAAEEDREPWSEDELWALGYLRIRVAGVPKCEACGRLLLRAACWWCEQERARRADERARELERKLRAWDRHKAVYSARARARREAKAAAV